ncbi:MAG: class II aldolase/adducin family protein [Betaproteobacteria bacterium]|nr:class II aldolase/adducin family protein [Betaproteobacteria bacterium]
MTGAARREALCVLARSMYDRGLTHGSTGNLSLRTDDGFLMTPTGSSLGALDPARLAVLDASGRHVGGDAPTERPPHLAMTANGPGGAGDLHARTVAVSVLADVDPANVLPPLTAYYAIRTVRGLVAPADPRRRPASRVLLPPLTAYGAMRIWRPPPGCGCCCAGNACAR